MQRLQVGDSVLVTAGANKSDQVRKVLKLVKGGQRVVVEGANMVKRHTSPGPEQPGGIIEREAPIHISNVMPVDPETGKPTRVRVKTEDGKKVRIAKSGAVITKATEASE